MTHPSAYTSIAGVISDGSINRSSGAATLRGVPGNRPFSAEGENGIGKDSVKSIRRMFDGAELHKAQKRETNGG
jgi:hypothetical protein